MKVLIADDNDASCRLLRAILEEEGHQVIAAGDGQEALGLLEGEPVDAIISDLLMPNLDGFRLCREIRANSRWHKIPFICYTAIYCSLDDEKLAFDLGADAYLRKPSSKAALLNTLKEALERARNGVARHQRVHAELDILTEYSQPLVSELEHKHNQLGERNRLAELLGAVGVSLTRRQSLGKTLQSCVDSMVKCLDAALASIWILNQQKAALELRASAAADSPREGVQLGQGMAGRIMMERRPYRTDSVLEELSAWEQEWARAEGVATFAGYPLIVEERLVGVMAVFTRIRLPESSTATLSVIADSIALGVQSKWAEADLRESEGRFRQLAENIREVFWMSDPTKRTMLYVSPAYEAIWGLPRNGSEEGTHPFIGAIHPDDRPRVLDPVGTGSHIPYELEYRIVRPDGGVRWIRDRAFPVRDAGGMVYRIVGVAEDVTEKRQLEAQLRQSQKMQAIGQLAGGVAHDFNNMLAVIFGHSAILAEALDSRERLRDSVIEINQAAERAAALTRQLLTFSRQQVVEPKVLNLGSVLDESEHFLSRLVGEDLHLAMTYPPDLSKVNVDPGQITQVLMNLVVNARDAMPQGGELKIEASNVAPGAAAAGAIHPEMRPGRYVLLSVSDTGHGMTPEVQAHIFEPFFSTKRDSTGLGLAVVEGIIKQNGGHLSVASRQGSGTTFFIYLPVVDEDVKWLSPEPAAEHLTGNETILLVEDNEPVRAVTSLLLESFGYQVLQVANGEEALALVENTRTQN